MKRKQRFQKWWAFAAVFIAFIPIQAANTPLKKGDSLEEYARTITVAELREHVFYLASDKMEGRQSGTKGAQSAAKYIAKHFQELDLKGFFSKEHPYFQKFEMEKKELVECYLKNENGRVDNWKDFLEFYSDFSGEKEVELILLGYGRRSDIEEIDIKGKLVAMFSGGPKSLVSAGDLDREKVGLVFEQGALGYLMISQEQDENKFLNYVKQVKPYIPSVRHYMHKTPAQGVSFHRKIDIAPSAVAKLFGMSPDEFKSVSNDLKDGRKREKTYKTKLLMKTSYKKHGIVPTENVLGYIEGTAKKDEFIILTAHYDGRGKNGDVVLNGANDNATGVAAIIEIAEAFSIALDNGHLPRRSIIFMMPVAEELGGIGSLYYVENPAVPLKNTIVDINMDPLGREDAERPDLKNHVHIYCSKNGGVDLNDIRTKVGKEFVSSLRIEIKKSYKGSDNVMFEMRGIPAIAFTTGQSKDNHGPGDDPDRVEYKKLKDITKLIFAYVWEIANSNKTIRRSIRMTK